MKHFKMNGRRSFACLMLFGLMALFASCSDDDGINKPNYEPYDASQPVTFESFSPLEGGSTTQMIITGSNFGNDTSLVKVKVGNRYAKVVGVSPTKIYCVVKAHSADSTSYCDVSVQVGEKEEHLFENKFYYELMQMVSTVAGTGGDATSDDVGRIAGDAMESTFGDITWLTCSKDGTLYICEENNSFSKMTADYVVSVMFTTNWRKRGMAFSLNEDTMYLARDSWSTSDPCLYYMTVDDDYSVLKSANQGYTYTCNGVSVNPKDGYLLYNQYADGTLYLTSPGDISSKHEAQSNFHQDNSREVVTCWSRDGKTMYRTYINSHYIRKRSYDPRTHAFTGEEQNFAGTEYGNDYADGVGTAARFSSPWQCCCDAEGNLYVADAGNDCIRKVTPSGIVTLYAGTREEGLVNGLPLKSQFNNPQGLCFAPDESLYVGERGNHTIRRIVVE